MEIVNSSIRPGRHNIRHQRRPLNSPADRPPIKVILPIAPQGTRPDDAGETAAALRQLTAEMTNLGPIDIPYFPLCPVCGRELNTCVNVYRYHFLCCETHQVFFCWGSNLLSNWRFETTGEWKRNLDELRSFNPGDFTDFTGLEEAAGPRTPAIVTCSGALAVSASSKTMPRA